MPANPQILKEITFLIDTEDFSLDVIDAAVVPEPGAVQTVKTLDGVTHRDAEGETWGVQLRCVVDWDTTRPGLASYLFTEKGTQKTFRLRKDTAAISTTNPEIQGTVTIVPIQYGGEGNTFAEADVFLPIDGEITVDTTP